MITYFTKGKIAVNEEEVTCIPRIWNDSYGVISVHGREAQNGGGREWLPTAARWPIMRGVGEKITMLSPDLGGLSTWGNNVLLSRMDATKNYLWGLPSVKTGKVKLLGQSMGGLGALVWAAANPTLVDRIVLVIPVLNLLDVRNNSSYGPEIDVAYGGSYSEATHGPTHNPLTMALAGKFANIPIQMWYGDADVLCKPEYSVAFANAAGNCEAHALSGNHEESTVLKMDTSVMVDFMEG